MPISVFLSHSAADVDLIRKVENHARTLDVLTYAYEDDQQGGQSVATKLQERIRTSDAVILLLTHNSQHRPGIHTEVGIARGFGKPIIPVIEVGVDPAQFIFLQGLEWIPLDLTKLDEALLGVQRSLKRMKENANNSAMVTAAIMVVIITLLMFAAKQEAI